MRFICNSYPTIQAQCKIAGYSEIQSSIRSYNQPIVNKVTIPTGCVLDNEDSRSKITS